MSSILFCNTFRKQAKNEIPHKTAKTVSFFSQRICLSTKDGLNYGKNQYGYTSSVFLENDLLQTIEHPLHQNCAELGHA